MRRGEDDVATRSSGAKVQRRLAWRLGALAAVPVLVTASATGAPGDEGDPASCVLPAPVEQAVDELPADTRGHVDAALAALCDAAQYPGERTFPATGSHLFGFEYYFGDDTTADCRLAPTTVGPVTVHASAVATIDGAVAVMVEATPFLGLGERVFVHDEAYRLTGRQVDGSCVALDFFGKRLVVAIVQASRGAVAVALPG